jgi:hypothetical protein
MRNNDTIRLQYASKFSTLENAYKKWKGELLGFNRFDALNKKKSKEKLFMSKPENSGINALYMQYDDLTKQLKPLNFANDFYAEGFPGVEILNIPLQLNKLEQLCDSVGIDEKFIHAEIEKVKKGLSGSYRNFNAAVDKKIFKAVIGHANEKLTEEFLPSEISDLGKSQEEINKNTDKLYKRSIFSDSSGVFNILNGFKKSDISTIKKDPAYKIAIAIIKKQREIAQSMNSKTTTANLIQRKYMAAVLADGGTKIYPDANSTMRVTYGRVEGVSPNDGMFYKHYTTTDGILQKSVTGNPDYEIPQKLGELISNKNYGRYVKNETVPVAFISSAHTTGGNSGSPALNAKGELIGLNYDRMWEGVLSDYYYDEKYCRNICLDIRYVLFIIDKFGNASNLINEMNIKY